MLTQAAIKKFGAVPMDKIKALDQAERIAQFGFQSTVAQRAFATMGKLYRAISAELAAHENITNTLRAAGVKDGTISNASYASKVWVGLVEPSHLSEDQYDGFTFADCLAIVRVTGGKSAKRLSPFDVAAVVNAKPETFAAEFNSLYESGLTIEEADAKVKADEETAAVKKAADEAAAQAAIDAQIAAAKKEAEDKAETVKNAAVAAALKQASVAPIVPMAATPAAPAATIPPVTPIVTKTPTVPVAPAPTIPAATTPTVSTPTVPATPVAPTVPVAPMPAAPVASPATNIHQIPPPKQAAAVSQLPEILDTIDTIVVEIGELTPAERERAFEHMAAALSDLAASMGKSIGGRIELAVAA